jgi:eukaryotic-like serine/threonine-protein kinase
VCPPGKSNQDPLAREPLTRGTQVGRFVVLGILGRGGMGEVYAAHDPELDRTVAIKLLRTLDTWSHAPTDGRARLMREAQAIARVSHPNVVVVYDVGTFDGRVFIAMEFIDGHTLGYWLQAKTRTMAEILDVFMAAGSGLEAAHEKELVHRDFKPENVMVGADGKVHVMDFGLARLPMDADKRTADRNPSSHSRVRPPVDPDYDPFSTRIIDGATSGGFPGVRLSHESFTASLTQTGSIMGTPAYMSPEQFRGDAADARTDQFSFCVALYEALYGERPFGGETLAELTANVVAGNVRSPPSNARVPDLIRGILLRGVSPDPQARFPSMGALLARLRLEPALAAAQRFAAGAAAKLDGIWEAPEPDVSRETGARTDIRRAFVATTKPYAMAAFDAASRILDRFVRRWTELYVDTCAATHTRGEQSTEILDLRMGALEESLGDLRALCRQFRQATPDLVENAVKAANALGTLERCADVKLLRAIVRPPEDPATRATVERLKLRLSEVRALAHVGRVADGLKAVVALENDAREAGYAPLLAEVLFASGLMHAEVSDVETATRTLEDAVWTAELCRHDEVIAEAAANLIFLTGHAQSRFDVGEIWSRHAEIVLSRMGGHDLIRGWLFNNRGAMRATQGRLRDAVEDMQQAIVAKERALGPEDPDVAISISNIAIYLDELGETSRAAEYTERALRIMETSLGPDHPKVAIPLANYAELLNRLGRFDEARDIAQRALGIFERETDPQGIYVTYPLCALGLSYIGMGRFAEAVPPLERAVRIREAKENVLTKLADAHFALGRALRGAVTANRAADLGDRAHEQVARARAEYLRAPSTPATHRELEEIDRWLGCNEK